MTDLALRLGAALIGGWVFAIAMKWSVQNLFVLLGFALVWLHPEGKPTLGGHSQSDALGMLMGVAVFVLLLIFPEDRLLWLALLSGIIATFLLTLLNLGVFLLARSHGKVTGTWRDFNKRGFA